MLREINRKDLFEDDKDKQKFIETLIFYKEKRNEIIRKAKEIEGLSIRQIVRVTGISFNIVKAL